MGKIGFACKWIDAPDQVNGIHKDDDAKQYNTGTTTISWLNRQTKDVAEQRLWDLMVQNLTATKKLVDRVGEQDENLRMVRISSDILPAYTEPTWSYFWRRADVVRYLERNFSIVGDSARKSGTRLSMHPGQFVVLASVNEGIVQRSIEEFEYHVDMARWMGYGKSFQDFKINVHISGKQGPEGIRSALRRLTPEARNCITIENDENCWGIESSLELAKDCALVLDVHHHWIRTGEYIQPTDDRVLGVIESWRGVRPAMHYSVSREDYLIEHDKNTMPDYNLLLETGYKKQKLRAHSDFYWNQKTNEWAITFLNQFDIMCESKGKNLASRELYNQAKSYLENN
jgi:UV DNA damage repair endonuclease